MNNIIEIEHLSKRFGEVQAVKDLSFRVKEGELFAFLGVNGAGKSTSINILCGQLPKDSGSVRIDGTMLDENPDAIKRSLGVVFQNSVLDKDLTVRENLESRAALYGIRDRAFREAKYKSRLVITTNHSLPSQEGQRSRRQCPLRSCCRPARWW